ncbi:hypothetical protein Angca_001110, partial [Angiostrongylus cantonensis]
YKYPAMDDLLKRRLVTPRPLEHVGIDYLSSLSMRNAEYIMRSCGKIPICNGTRLLYKELVQNITVDELLLAIRRFITRGVPSTITSDNAPNSTLEKQIL